MGSHLLCYALEIHGTIAPSGGFAAVCQEKTCTLLPQNQILYIHQQINSFYQSVCLQIVIRKELSMRILKVVFSILTIVFAVCSLMQLIPSDLSMPIMFLFMALTMLVNAKEFYDTGAKWDARLFAALALFLFGITFYNVLSPLI